MDRFGNFKFWGVISWALALALFMSFFEARAQVQSKTQTEAPSPLWETQNFDWLKPDSSGQTWEDKYSKWVNDPNKVNTELFTSPLSPLYGIEADCADAVYAIRLLFAYENHLPFVIPGVGNTIALSNESNFGQTHLSPIKRFRAFVRKVLEITGTGTLVRDTFPINITPACVTPGKIMLYYSSKDVTKKRHSHTLVGATGALTFISATQTPEVKELDILERIITPPDTYGEDGLRGWRDYRQDPVTRRYSLVPLHEQTCSQEYPRPAGEKFFSQFDEGLFPRKNIEWGDAIAAQVGAKVTLQGLINTVCNDVHKREEVVLAGRAHFADNPHCPSDRELEDYSTEHLDNVIWTEFKAIDNWIIKHRPVDPNGDQTEFKKERDFRDNQFQACKLGKTDSTNRLDLRWVRLAFKNRMASADPDDLFALQRWGLFDAVNLNSDPTPQGFYEEDWPAEYEDRMISYTGCPVKNRSESTIRQRSAERVQ